jgi:hypothetical protein
MKTARDKIADAADAFNDAMRASGEHFNRLVDSQEFLLQAIQAAEDYAAGRCGLPRVVVPDGAQMAPTSHFQPIQTPSEEMPRYLRGHERPPPAPAEMLASRPPADEPPAESFDDEIKRLSKKVDFAWADGHE